MPLNRRLLRAFCAALALLLAPASALADRPMIAAASTLEFALKDVAERFHDETGREVRLNFGSSGNFRRQIAQGAPFEIYMSADEDYVFALEQDGHTQGSGTLYAVGRLVVLARPGDPDDILDGSLETLRERLEEGAISRFAIANPEHAPYGVAAREALQSQGLWDTIRPRLVFGENVSQAARTALAAEVQGGIVSYSLALAPPVAARSEHALIPDELHAPLRQRMVLLDGAGETARMFYDFLQGEAAREVLEEFGFALPEDG